MRTPLIAVLLLLILQGCASKFKPLKSLDVLDYSAIQMASDSLLVSYNTEVQSASGNKRYVAKENTYGIFSVAVKIENVSSKPITLDRSNFWVTSADGSKQSIYSAESYSNKIKQRVGAHLWHTFWSPWAVSWSEDDNGQTHTSFIIIPIGFFVGLGNAIRAHRANEANLKAHKDLQIWSKTILPNQTLYGLLPIRTINRGSYNFNYSEDGVNTSVPVNAINNQEYVPAPFKNSKELKFQISLKNHKLVTINSKIENEGGEFFIETRIDGAKTTLHPLDTEWISCTLEDGVRLIGVPNDDSWLFTVIRGEVNGYFYLPDPHSVSDIQKEKGPIVPFTPSTLKSMIGGDPDVDKLIDRQKYIDAILMYNKLESN